MYRVQPIFQNGHFGEYSNSPKLANFWRVLKFDKFAGEWPLLTFFPMNALTISLKKTYAKNTNLKSNQSNKNIIITYGWFAVTLKKCHI
jgi:hypothetical protein